jgi:hypothetical protein
MAATRRNLRWLGRIIVGVLLATMTSISTPGSVAAFCAASSKWPGGGVGVDAFLTSTWPQGFVGAGRNAILGWNGVAGSTFRFDYYPPGSLGPPWGGWVHFDNQGAPAFQGAPGVTITWKNGSTIYRAETWLNPAFSWNANGVMNQQQSQADVHTVTMHEMGHWLTLVHPSQCGEPITAAEAGAVMHPNWTTKWSLNSDDRAGSAYMY